jgi:hypothetical protein
MEGWNAALRGIPPTPRPLNMEKTPLRRPVKRGLWSIFSGSTPTQGPVATDLDEALTTLLGHHFPLLAPGGVHHALLDFGGLIVALLAAELAKDARLLAGLRETAECPIKGFALTNTNVRHAFTSFQRVSWNTEGSI